MMRADSPAGQILAVVSRRTPAFQPLPGEPSTFPGLLHWASVTRIRLPLQANRSTDVSDRCSTNTSDIDIITFPPPMWSRSSDTADVAAPYENGWLDNVVSEKSFKKTKLVRPEKQLDDPGRRSPPKRINAAAAGSPVGFALITVLGIIAMVLGSVAVVSSHGSLDSGGASSHAAPLTGNALLTSADMEQAAGGSWQTSSASPQSLRFSCFPLPASPSKSVAIRLSEAHGAQLYEVIDYFPTAAVASQAYMSFASAADNCSWQDTSNEGVASQFTAVAYSNAQNLDSASGLWDIQGAPVGLSATPSHDGAICAVRSGNLDAFAFIMVDSSNSPSMAIIESNIEPMLASKL